MIDRPEPLLEFAKIIEKQTRTNPKTGQPRTGDNVSEIDDRISQYGFDMFEGVGRGYLNYMFRQLSMWGRYLAERCNRPEQYTKAAKPTATNIIKGFGPGSMIYISDIDGVGQPGIAFSDGANWRKVKDNSIVLGN